MSKKSSKIAIRTKSINIFILFAIIVLFGCKPKYYQGKVLYDSNCANCHGEFGEGLKKLYPPLKNSDYLKKHAEQLPCIIRYGLNDTISVNNKIYTTPMAGHPELSSIDLTNLVNYIEKNFINNNVNYSPRDINTKLESCK